MQWKLLELLIIKLVSMLLEQSNKNVPAPVTDESIDARLAKFKDAYKDAFNGQPVTTEQRQKLNEAISSFIRGANGL
jgi:hypothetical protein